MANNPRCHTCNHRPGIGRAREKKPCGCECHRVGPSLTTGIEISESWEGYGENIKAAVIHWIRDYAKDETKERLYQLHGTRY